MSDLLMRDDECSFSPFKSPERDDSSSSIAHVCSSS